HHHHIRHHGWHHGLQYGHVNSRHHHHHHHHHHSPRSGKNENTTAEVNRKINEIMNLYNVSIQAANEVKDKLDSNHSPHVDGSVNDRAAASEDMITQDHHHTASHKHAQERMDLHSPQHYKLKDPPEVAAAVGAASAAAIANSGGKIRRPMHFEVEGTGLNMHIQPKLEESAVLKTNGGRGGIACGGGDGACKYLDTHSSSQHRNHQHSQSVGQAPQIGGVRLYDPLDPRIDVEKLYNSNAAFPGGSEDDLGDREQSQLSRPKERNSSSYSNIFSGATSKSETSLTNNNNDIIDNNNNTDTNERHQSQKEKKHYPQQYDQQQHQLYDQHDDHKPSGSLLAQASEYNTSMEHCYSNLMEACRPFFRDNYALLANRHLINASAPYMQHASEDGAQSSSGFTSFFTTTKSESNHTNSGSGGSFSDGTQSHHDAIKLNTEERRMEETSLLEDGSNSSDVPPSGGHNRQDVPGSQQGRDESSDRAAHAAAVAHSLPEVNDADLQSDSSSMVVLARVKRKHKEHLQKVHSPSTSDNTTDNKKVDHVVVNGSSGRCSSDGVSNSKSNINSKGEESGTSNKRVRIETVALDAAKMRKISSSSSKLQRALKSAKQLTPSQHQEHHHQQEHQQSNGRTESSSFTSSLSTSLDSSGSDTGGGGAAANGQSNNNAAEGSKNDADASNNNSSNSSSRHNPSATDISNSISTAGKPPHVVTDISSGTTTANNSSGSGSNSGSGSGMGSGNDTQNENGATTSKSESGGDGTNSDEQKVSNEPESTVGSETGAEENIPAMDVGLKSDEIINCSNNNSRVGQSLAQGKLDSKPLIHHHHHGGRHGTAGNRIEKGDDGKLGLEHGSDEGTNSNKIINSNGNVKEYGNVHQEDMDAIVSKEKILEKKRKRMNMRREYEEEVRQMRDSSESSSCQHHESAFEPGRPVTLEEVLSFTKTARYVVNCEFPPHVGYGFDLAGLFQTTMFSTQTTGSGFATILGCPYKCCEFIPFLDANDGRPQ
ncbi:hypothetical protein ACHAXS_013518, partial [Conticribra weissflogii]